MATSSLISLKRGDGVFSDYVNTLSFPTYVTNIVSALSSVSPICEPWFDKTHKQLWVDKQVINPKLVAGSNITLSEVRWDPTDGAYMTITANIPTPDQVTGHDLVFGTYVANTSPTPNTYSNTATYHPLTATGSVNGIYIGSGLQYTWDSSTGYLHLDTNDKDWFLDSVTPTGTILTFHWNTASGKSDTVIDFAGYVDPSYRDIYIDNSSAATAVTGSAAGTHISAYSSLDMFKLKGGNKWINVRGSSVSPDATGTYSPTDAMDTIELGHKLSTFSPTSDTSSANAKQTTDVLSYDEAGHITGKTTYNIDYSPALRALNANKETTVTIGSSTYYRYANWELNTGGGKIKLRHDPRDTTNNVGSDILFDADSSTDVITAYITHIDGGTF